MVYTLYNNPFRQLGLSPEASCDEVRERTEELLLEEDFEPSELQHCLAQLCSEQDRLAAEIAWLPETQHLHTTELMEDVHALNDAVMSRSFIRCKACNRNNSVDFPGYGLPKCERCQSRLLGGRKLNNLELEGEFLSQANIGLAVAQVEHLNGLQLGLMLTLRGLSLIDVERLTDLVSVTRMQAGFQAVTSMRLEAVLDEHVNFISVYFSRKVLATTEPNVILGQTLRAVGEGLDGYGLDLMNSLVEDYNNSAQERTSALLQSIRQESTHLVNCDCPSQSLKKLEAQLTEWRVLAEPQVLLAQLRFAGVAPLDETLSHIEASIYEWWDTHREGVTFSEALQSLLPCLFLLRRHQTSSEKRAKINREIDDLTESLDFAWIMDEANRVLQARSRLEIQPLFVDTSFETRWSRLYEAGDSDRIDQAWQAVLSASAHCQTGTTSSARVALNFLRKLESATRPPLPLVNHVKNIKLALGLKLHF